MSIQLWDKTLIGEITHAEWLKRHASEYTLDEIMAVLNRSKASVTGKLKREGLEAKGPESAPANEVCGIPVESLLAEIKDEPRSLGELSHRFDRSEDTIRRSIEQLEAMSYEINQTEASRHVWSTKAPGIVAPPSTLWDKEVWDFKLGVMSDPHIGSKATQISALNKAIDVMYERGVRHVLVCGDINAGREMYSGQALDTVSERADEQMLLAKTYWAPKDGLKFYLMGGNHDWSFVKRGGFNAVKELCKQREDFIYCGFNLATVPLTPDIDALMWHPSGGVPYAVSYRAQKMAEQVAMEQLMETLEKNMTPKVRFLFCGHLHIFVQFWQGPIFVAHVGCFEGQTDYLKKKALYPHLGCLILEGSFTKEMALIRNMAVTHLRFTEIEDDYLNYPVPREEEETEILFKWEDENN